MLAYIRIRTLAYNQIRMLSYIQIWILVYTQIRISAYIRIRILAYISPSPSTCCGYKGEYLSYSSQPIVQLKVYIYTVQYKYIVHSYNMSSCQSSMCLPYICTVYMYILLYIANDEQVHELRTSITCLFCIASIYNIFPSACCT